MPITQETYRALTLEDPDHQWELFRGKLMEKPSMSVSHNRTMARLAHQLSAQLDIERFEVRTNTGRLRYTDETYFIPDVHIVPVALMAEPNESSEALEVLTASMPFVAEVWSPSTGGYDVDRKIPEYQRRGDSEIWRLHPYERSVTMFRRRDDGSYVESVVTSETVLLLEFPNVVVDVDELFAFGTPVPGP
jgi:Uma2 family endonuclease